MYEPTNSLAAKIAKETLNHVSFYPSVQNPTNAYKQRYSSNVQVNGTPARTTETPIPAFRIFQRKMRTMQRQPRIPVNAT